MANTKQPATQIYTIVNALLGQGEGGDLAVVDTESLVATGQDVINSESLGNAFMSSLSNMVGKTIVSSRAYQSDEERLLLVDDMEYGNILRKISFPLNQMTEDQSYKLTEGQSIDMYKVHIVQPVQKFFTKQTPFAQSWTTQRAHLKKAFHSAEEMGSFLSAYRNVFANSMRLALENLAHACMVNFICEVSEAADTRVVKLITEYKKYNADFAKTGIAALTDEGFMAFCVSVIKNTMNFMTKYNKGTYNDGTVDRFTPYDRQRLILNSQFEQFMNTSVKYKAFNREDVTIAAYGTLPYWQSAADPMGVYGGTGAGTQQTNVVGILSDVEAFGIYRHDYRINTSPYNITGEYWNTEEKCENLYFNDFSENFVIFTLE